MELVPRFQESGTDSMLKFFTGSIDVAYVGFSPLMLGLYYGMDLRVLAVATELNGSLAVVGRDDSASDRRRSLGTVFGSNGHVLALEFVETFSRSERPLLIHLDPPECLDSFSQGALDFVSLWSPFSGEAVSIGGETIFSDAELPFRTANFLVASGRALERKGRAVSAFTDCHREALGHLNDDFSVLEELRHLMASDLEQDEFELMLRTRHSWPRASVYEDPAELHDFDDCFAWAYSKHSGTSSEESRATIEGTSLISPLRMEGVDVDRDSSEVLNVGYSRDVMCAPFFLGDHLEIFSSKGFKLRTDRRQLSERVGRLSTQFRDDLRLCLRLSSEDPALAIQKLGRVNEVVFRKLHDHQIGPSPKSLAAVIEGLRARDAAPHSILSWGDSVRSIRNIAVHHDEGGSEIDEEQARSALRIFVGIAEWFESVRPLEAERVQRCPRCNQIVERDWITCPNCALSIEGRCPKCGRELESHWKACPDCGQNIF